MKRVTLLLTAAMISAAAVFPSFAAAGTQASYGQFLVTAVNTAQKAADLTVQIPDGYVESETDDNTVAFINEAAGTVVSIAATDIGVDVNTYFNDYELKALTEESLTEVLADEQNPTLNPVQTKAVLASGTWMRYQYDNYKIDNAKFTAVAYVRYAGQYMDMFLVLTENSHLQDVNADQVVDAFIPTI